MFSISKKVIGSKHISTGKKAMSSFAIVESMPSLNRNVTKNDSKMINLAATRNYFVY